VAEAGTDDRARCALGRVFFAFFAFFDLFAFRFDTAFSGVLPAPRRAPSCASAGPSGSGIAMPGGGNGRHAARCTGASGPGSPPVPTRTGPPSSSTTTVPSRSVR